MDATTILAIICCALVLTGWLLLPHSTESAKKTKATAEREPISLSA